MIAAGQETTAPAHLHVGFNQDNGCFAVGEATGFRIFNTHPFNEQVCSAFGHSKVRASVHNLYCKGCTESEQSGKRLS